MAGAWGSGSEPSAAVRDVVLQEQAAGLETFEAWADFQQRAEAAKNGLLRFLLQEQEAGRTVMGYGAAAKGNTLLNYAGVRSDLCRQWLIGLLANRAAISLAVTSL